MLFVMYICSNHVACVCIIIAEVEETDKDETDSVEQPRITSTALKMQMTLRSMLDLGTYLCIPVIA